MRQKLQQKKLWDQIETFAKVMGPKLQQKNLWDQIETFAKVMGPKVYFSQIWEYLNSLCFMEASRVIQIFGFDLILCQFNCVYWSGLVGLGD